jgi:hypothetical protein
MTKKKPKCFGVWNVGHTDKKTTAGIGIIPIKSN